MVANGFDGVPWFIGGGAKHSPDVARMIAYAALGGREGVIRPADLKVTASATTDGNVHMGTGSVAILNRSANAVSQMYGGRATLPSDIAIGSTGASGRSDLIVARVEDPQFPPWQAYDPTTQLTSVQNGPYIFPRVIAGVSSGTTSASQLGGQYATHSMLAIARIDIPANTTKITQSMIKDLRKLAQPHASTDVQILNAQQSGDFDLTSSSFVFWPASGNGINSNIFLPVPEWATQAFVEIQVNSFAHVDGDFIGELRILLDTVAAPSVALDLNGGVGNAEHVNQSVWAKFDVTGFQGRNVPIALQGLRWNGYTGVVRTRPYTQYVMRTNFYELPI